MARTLIGNFKGPQGPRGERGPEGPQGPRGLQGETGSNQLESLGANLVSLSPKDWRVGGINSVTGNVDSTASSMVTNYFINIEPGEDYTFTFENNTGLTARLNWYEFTDGVYPGVDGWSGAYPQDYTFTATGNNLVVRVYLGRSVTLDDLKDVVVKLEKGNESTPYYPVFEEHDRLPTEKNEGYVNVVANPFNIEGTSSASPTKIESFTVDENTEQITDGVFSLSPGFWVVDMSTRTSVHDIDGGYTLGLYYNGTLIKRETKNIRSGKTLGLSTTLNVKQGDTFYFGFSTYSVSTTDMNNLEFTISQQAGNNRITMKKVGG